MPVTLDRIIEIADDAASAVNNVLALGTSNSEHRKMRLQIGKAIARALAEERFKERTELKEFA